jgi:hypothetical protein
MSPLCSTLNPVYNIRLRVYTCRWYSKDCGTVTFLQVILNICSDCWDLNNRNIRLLVTSFNSNGSIIFGWPLPKSPEIGCSIYGCTHHRCQGYGVRSAIIIAIISLLHWTIAVRSWLKSILSINTVNREVVLQAQRVLVSLRWSMG